MGQGWSGGVVPRYGFLPASPGGIKCGGCFHAGALCAPDQSGEIGIVLPNLPLAHPSPSRPYENAEERSVQPHKSLGSDHVGTRSG